MYHGGYILQYFAIYLIETVLLLENKPFIHFLTSRNTAFSIFTALTSCICPISSVKPYSSLHTALTWRYNGCSCHLVFHSGSHLGGKGSNNTSFYPTQVYGWTNYRKDHWAYVGSLVRQAWYQKQKVHVTLPGALTKGLWNYWAM